MTIGPETLAALALVIAAIGTAIVNIMTARTVRKKVEENNVLTTETLVEAKEIKHHVNSAATKAQAQIELLLQKVAMLEASASVNKEIASNLAIHAEIDKKVPTPVPEKPVLEKIEENTSQTVQELKKEKK